MPPGVVGVVGSVVVTLTVGNCQIVALFYNPKKSALFHLRAKAPKHAQNDEHRLFGQID